MMHRSYYNMLKNILREAEWAQGSQSGTGNGINDLCGVTLFVAAEFHVACAYLITTIHAP